MWFMVSRRVLPSALRASSSSQSNARLNLAGSLLNGWAFCYDLTMNDKLTKPYNPGETEPRIYKLWEDSGFFNPDICIAKGVTKADAPVFSMVMPPPNVTGVLHMGHAMMLTVEDIMVRFKRMQGFRTLWLP